MSNLKESRAVLEVRAWKAELDAEHAHLSVREAVQKRLADAAEIAERLGFRYAPVAKVAETPAKCRTGRRPTKAKAI